VEDSGRLSRRRGVLLACAWLHRCGEGAVGAGAETNFLADGGRRGPPICPFDRAPL